MLQLDKDETMWSMSMSNVSRRAYYSTGRGIAGLALRTGQRINISTPKEHPHFDAQGDLQRLCIPRRLPDLVDVRVECAKPGRVLRWGGVMWLLCVQWTASARWCRAIYWPSPSETTRDDASPCSR